MFERKRTLGAGGMGEVFLALDPRTGADVVVKVLRQDVPAQALERFEREFQVLSRLKHDAIVPVLEWGRLPTGEPYYAMPYVEAVNLEAWIAKAGGPPVPQDQALAVLAPVAAALDYLHAAGLRHRDVKPSNILVAGGKGLLIDFGLVGLVQSELTRTGMVLGTMQYLSPEQARGEDAGPASDVYQLGLVLYELATGTRACGDAYRWVDEFKQGRRPFPAPAEREPRVGAGLAEVILAATAHEPAARPTSAGALVERLRAVTPERWRGARTTRRTRPVPAAVPPPRPPYGVVAAVVASFVFLGGMIAMARGRCTVVRAPALALRAAVAEVSAEFTCPTALRVTWQPEGAATERVVEVPASTHPVARLEPLEPRVSYAYAVSAAGRALDRGRFTAPERR